MYCCPSGVWRLVSPSPQAKQPSSHRFSCFSLLLFITLCVSLIDFSLFPFGFSLFYSFSCFSLAWATSQQTPSRKTGNIIKTMKINENQSIMSKKQGKKNNWKKSQSGLRRLVSPSPPSQSARVSLVFLVFVQSVDFFYFRLVLLVFIVFHVFRWSELPRNNPGPLSPVSCFGWPLMVLGDH